jgi:hypothetical protein
MTQNSTISETSDSEDTHAPVWLSVSFDADQLGGQLCWSVTEGNENMYATYGRFAGSLHLPKDRDLRVRVRGYGGRDLRAFKVLSADLVTISGALRDSASPFVGQQTAVTQVGDLPPADQIVWDPRIERASGMTSSVKPFRLRDENGAWSLSMVLTVRIETVDAEGLIVKRTRVFGFDPEAFVGNGTR